jgi:hypothetical protein
LVGLLVLGRCRHCIGHLAFAVQSAVGGGGGRRYGHRFGAERSVEVVSGLSKLGLEFQSFPELLDCLLGLAFLVESDAEVVVTGSVIGV